jgi:uncharacterized protein (DUF3084 family)
LVPDRDSLNHRRGRIPHSAGSSIVEGFREMTTLELEEQIKNLDTRSAAVEQILPTLATKEDLMQALRAQLNRMEARFDAVDIRFNRIDSRFSRVDAQLTKR